MFDPSRLPPERPVREPILRVPPATLLLAFAIVAAFIVVHFVLSAEQEEAVLARFGFLPLRFEAWLAGLEAPGPALWPLATHLFLHIDSFHLLTNVLLLFAVATPVERRLGWPALLGLFFVCGIAGALTHLWLAGDAEATLIGASASVFGLFAAALVLAPPRAPNRMRLLPVIVVLMVVNVAIGLASNAGLVGGYEIGWQAHAGGFAMGLLAAWPFRRRAQRYP